MRHCSYSQKDVEIIQECISKTPTNLQAAFECAAERLGKTKTSVSGFYYQRLKHGSTKLLVTGSKSMMAINTKNSPRINDNITIADIVRMNKNRLSKAERLEIISLLF